MKTLLLILPILLLPGLASAQWVNTYPGTNYWNGEWHTQSYGVPTAPANALPKLTTATGARTGTIANGSNSLLLSGAPPAGLAVGNWVAVQNAGFPCGTNWAATTGTTYNLNCATTASGNENSGGPTIPASYRGTNFSNPGNSGGGVVVYGTPGSTTDSYQICTYDGAGSQGECSATFSTSTGAATQTYTNWNLLVWNWNQNGVPEAEICKSFAGTYEPIGIALHDSFYDVGQAAIQHDPDLPNCPGSQTTTQSNAEHLYAQITAINSNTLTLSATAQNTNCAGGGCAVWSDDAPMINDAINAAEAAATTASTGESQTLQHVEIDSGTYTIGSQIMTGEQFGFLDIRGPGATLISQNIAGPEFITNGSGCKFNSTTGYCDNYNRTARIKLEGFNLYGEGPTSSGYIQESGMYWGNTNGQYMQNLALNEFSDPLGTIQCNASGLIDDETTANGQGTSFTHIYFSNSRVIDAGGPWFNCGRTTPGDDVNIQNIFWKNAGQALGSNPQGPMFGNFFMGMFNPWLAGNRYQLENNTAYGIHMWQAQSGGIYGEYMQTPGAATLTSAMIDVDTSYGFSVTNFQFNGNSLTTNATDAVVFTGGSTNNTIDSPTLYNTSGSKTRFTNVVDFCSDSSGCTGNYVKSISYVGGGLKPVAYINRGTVNYVFPDTVITNYNINFTFDGTVTNSELRYRVCPKTIGYLPGAQASGANQASQGAAGGNPGAITTYTLQDVTGTVNPEIVGYLQTNGTMQFGTPACSPQVDGTPNETRSASAQTLNVTIPANAHAGDQGLLLCTMTGTGGTWTTPSGWSPVPNGSNNIGTLMAQLYEKNPLVNGDLGATLTCSNTATAAAISAAVWTFKGGPTTGEIVDTLSNHRSSSATSCAFNAVTPTANGDTLFALCGSIQNVTWGSWTAPLTQVATLNGTGAAIMYLGGTSATSGSNTATISTGSGTNDAWNIALLSGSTSCTLCTGGDLMKVTAPGTVSSETDVTLNFLGL